MKVAIISDRKKALREFVRGIGGDLDWFAEPGEFLRQVPQAFWNLVIVDSLLPDVVVRDFCRICCSPILWFTLRSSQT